MYASAWRYVWRNKRYLSPPNWRDGAKALYRRFSGSGVLFSEDGLGMASLHPIRKIECILALVNPRTVLDVGCGTGQALIDFKQRGLDVLGVEASRAAIRHSPRPDLICRHDLRKPLDLHRSFDMVWSFEVAEHIHPKFVDVFICNLTRHSSLVVMSAAPPGQGGERHFNEQPQSYWEKKFGSQNYILHREWTHALQSVDEFYSQNMMVFHKIVSGYPI